MGPTAAGRHGVLEEGPGLWGGARVAGFALSKLLSAVTKNRACTQDVLEGGHDGNGSIHIHH